MRYEVSPSILSLETKTTTHYDFFEKNLSMSYIFSGDYVFVGQILDFLIFVQLVNWVFSVFLKIT